MTTTKNESKTLPAAKVDFRALRDAVRSRVATVEPVLDRARRVAGDARRTGRNVWLAGLGVVATASDESRAAFGRLVDKGNTRNRLTVPVPVRDAAERVKEAGTKLEAEVETRVAATLGRLGVPTRTDIERLIEKVDTLSRKIEDRAEAV